ncbi:hypothetical protein ACOMHN_067283 [Nucella lapillus]
MIAELTQPVSNRDDGKACPSPQLSRRRTHGVHFEGISATDPTPRPVPAAASRVAQGCFLLEVTAADPHLRG